MKIILAPTLSPRSLRKIEAHRKLTMRRMSSLLEEAGIDLPVDMIEFVIFRYHHTRDYLFEAQMKAMFKSAARPIEKDIFLMVIRDAWNYFPHQSLSGGCPAQNLAILDERQSSQR
jgi:hypothetical protein